MSSTGPRISWAICFANTMANASSWSHTARTGWRSTISCEAIHLPGWSRSNSTGGRAGSTSSTNGPRLSSNDAFLPAPRRGSPQAEIVRPSQPEVWLGTRFLNMPFYQRLGTVPRKRHIQFRDNGSLLTEEVMGLEGFVGNESILYHLQSPCRVMKLG